MNIRNWEVKQALESDTSGLVAFYEQVGDESDLLSFGREGNETLASYVEHQETTLTRVFIIKDKNEIIGVINIVQKQKVRFAHIAELNCCVKKAYWQKGVASALMQHAMQYITQCNKIEEVELEVLTHNTAAVHLYQKFGFKTYATFENRMHLHNKSYDSYFMKKTMKGTKV